MNPDATPAGVHPVAKRVLPNVAVLAAAAAAGAPTLPFLRSGERVRSGYELVKTASSAGFLDDGPWRGATLALALLPLLAAGALLAAVLRATMGVATCAVAAGVVAAGAGAAAVQAQIRTEAGAWMSLTAGVAAMAVGLTTIALAR